MLDELPPLEYVAAESIEDAVALLVEFGDRAKILAGGTDLLGLMKDRIDGPGVPIPEVLVNVKTIPGLAEIAERPGGGLRIGAATTLADVERHPLVMHRFPALAQAAASVATTQIRAMGTVGGNLCQRPWCWYFRNGFPCYKAGGNQCFSVTGENEFNAIFGGVLVFSGVHVWTADTQGADARAAWLKNLDAMAARKPAVVVPGHMTPGAATDASAIHYTRDYLVAFEEELAKATDSTTLIAAMTKRYPSAGMGVALQIGAKVAKGEMKWG
jgi:hypothetical protein